LPDGEAVAAEHLSIANEAAAAAAVNSAEALWIAEQELEQQVLISTEVVEQVQYEVKQIGQRQLQPT
jgi:hypothetical protein